jgi:hypothetical protein
VIKKEAKKIVKYKDLIIDTECVWNVKTNVIPLIICTTGTISKSFRKYLSNKSGKHKIKELQKTTILGTAHILLYKHKRFNIGNSVICTMNSNYRIAVTLYSLEMWFVLGM